VILSGKTKDFPFLKFSTYHDHSFPGGLQIRPRNEVSDFFGVIGTELPDRKLVCPSILFEQLDFFGLDDFRLFEHIRYHQLLNIYRVL